MILNYSNLQLVVSPLHYFVILSIVFGLVIVYFSTAVLYIPVGYIAEKKKKKEKSTVSIVELF